ncbi:hypothetical protein VPH35_035739 [Triticum aestivum]|uniref:Anthocyanidin 5,3-O-glucosyltransferase n=1 Tax=Aegilops tauschii TaxID=37682 RepID=M8BPQ5_AEGTA
MVGAGTNTTMEARKLRVVLYPSPGMGHLVSMIELGKHLAARALTVTVALIDSPHDTSATGPFLAGVSAANPSISFHRLPQVELLWSEPPVMLTFEVVRLSNTHLHDFLAGDSPAVIVLDFFCSAAIGVAEELGIPAYFFCASGAQILAFFLHLPVLHGKSTRSFGEEGDRHDVIDDSRAMASFPHRFHP